MHTMYIYDTQLHCQGTGSVQATSHPPFRPPNQTSLVLPFPPFPPLPPFRLPSFHYLGCCLEQGDCGAGSTQNATSRPSTHRPSLFLPFPPFPPFRLPSFYYLGYGLEQGDCGVGGTQNTNFVRVELYSLSKSASSVTSITPKGKGKGKGADPPGGDVYWMQVPNGYSDFSGNYPCEFPKPSECQGFVGLLVKVVGSVKGLIGWLQGVGEG